MPAYKHCRKPASSVVFFFSRASNRREVKPHDLSVKRRQSREQGLYTSLIPDYGQTHTQFPSPLAREAHARKKLSSICRAGYGHDVLPGISRIPQHRTIRPGVLTNHYVRSSPQFMNQAHPNTYGISNVRPNVDVLLPYSLQNFHFPFFFLVAGPHTHT